MDEFFARMLLLEEGELILIAFAVIVAGGIVGSRIAKPERRFSRIQYLWSFAGIYLALIISQFGWLLVPAAAAAGMMSVLFVGLAACLVVAGAATYYASAARSNDTIGETKNAWMGFVPIANLWLIFSRGENRPEGEDGPSSFRRFVVNPVLVIGALIVFSIAQLFEKALEEFPAESLATTVEFSQLMSSVQTLEESLKTEAAASSAGLPMRIDEMTVFRSIEATGDTLVMNMEVERDIPGFRPDFKDGIAASVCRPDMFEYDINRGAKIVYSYTGPRGNLIDWIEITKANC